MRVTRSSHKSIWSTPATQKREDDEWMKFTKHFIFLLYIPSLPPSDTEWMVLHLILHHFPIEIVNSSSTHLFRFSHDIEENIDVACSLLHLWCARAVFSLLLKLENCYLHARDWILMSLHKNNNNFLLRIETPAQNMEFSEIHKLIKWNSHDWIESTSTMTLDINFIQLSFTRFTNIHDAYGRVKIDRNEKSTLLFELHENSLHMWFKKAAHFVIKERLSFVLWRKAYHARSLKMRKVRRLLWKISVHTGVSRLSSSISRLGFFCVFLKHSTSDS